MKYIKKFENKEPEKKVEYHDNGNIKTISYKLNGKLHREDGPAYIQWCNNGQKNSEIYYINGKYHREDGPAFQSWYVNGILQYQKYYLNHNEYDRKDWIEKLKEMNSPHYKEQKLLYDMEQNIKKYNL